MQAQEHCVKMPPWKWAEISKLSWSPHCKATWNVVEIKDTQCWNTDHFVEICDLSSYSHTHHVWHKPMKTRYSSCLYFILTTYLFFIYLISTIYISRPTDNIPSLVFRIFASLHTPLFILLVIDKDWVGGRDHRAVKSCSAGDQTCIGNLENLWEQSEGCGVWSMVVFI